jgi:pyridoxamine 5'-phosphate oxidase
LIDKTIVENISQYISEKRSEFSKGSLNENDIESLPENQFATWMEEAVQAQITEVQAFNLATVNAQNKPSNRTVYLRKFEHNQYYFYTNYLSQKSIDIEHNNLVAACFFYPELERQIRIEGIAARAETIVSDEYFNARPRESKIGAWSSPQSQKIKNREYLTTLVSDNEKKFAGQEIDRPPFWGGYVIKANYYEFWQGRKSRLHDRICYELHNEVWEIYRKAP